MQALFFALAAIAAQQQFRKSGRIIWILIVAMCSVAALYSQPFAIFAPLGFAGATMWQERNRRYVLLTAGAYGLSALLFLPWLMAVHASWADTIARSGVGFEWRLSLALVVIKECMGDGYATAVPALLLVLYAAYRPTSILSRHARIPLLAAVAFSIGLPLIADARFDYFYASRQFVYAVPFLLLLMADAAADCWERASARAPIAILLAVFIGASLVKDYRNFTENNEDWAGLSHALVSAAANGCILLPAGDEAAKYVLFQPDFPQKLCSGQMRSTVVIPIHPYSGIRAVHQAEKRLAGEGMFRQSIRKLPYATIEVFRQRTGIAGPTPA